MHGMRPFGALISKEDALARLLAAAQRVARTERVALRSARGRVAAADVRASVAVPPFARAMMDGYALRATDAAEPGARLRVAGEVFAGARSLPSVGAGECVRIATGAPLPPGADAVVRVEDTQEDAHGVTLAVALRPGASVDPAGSDVAVGAFVVRAGDVLSPARLGLLASVGVADVAVLARPRVALFTSGDELVAPGNALPAGAIYDSNTTTLATLFDEAGAVVALQPALEDDADAQRKALADASLTCDIIVLTGGASVGARDHTAAAVAAEGEVLFHGVRLKPGKPLLGGRVGRALVVGLPGNPTSALTNAYLFVLPTLRALAGLPAPWRPPVRARLSNAIDGDDARHMFLPVRLSTSAEGVVATPTFKGSGRLTSLVDSDAWVGVPEGARWAAGEPVDAHPW